MASLPQFAEKGASDPGKTDRAGQMVQSKATKVSDHLAGFPADRRRATGTLCSVVLDKLPEGYEESMQYGMIGYSVPLSCYPDTDNGAPLSLIGVAVARMPVDDFIGPYERARAGARRE